MAPDTKILIGNLEVLDGGTSSAVMVRKLIVLVAYSSKGLLNRKHCLQNATLLSDTGKKVTLL